MRQGTQAQKDANKKKIFFDNVKITSLAPLPFSPCTAVNGKVALVIKSRLPNATRCITMFVHIQANVRTSARLKVCWKNDIDMRTAGDSGEFLFSGKLFFTNTISFPLTFLALGCGKRFSRPDSLNTHIKTHSNERPYVCPHQGCKKAYFHSRSLKKHERAHEQQVSTTVSPGRSHPYYGAYRGSKTTTHDMLPANCSMEAMPNWVTGTWMPSAASAYPLPLQTQSHIVPVLPDHHQQQLYQNAMQANLMSSSNSISDSL
jgi:Zinc finger, C2H2 type